MGRKNSNSRNKQLTDFSHLINKIAEAKNTDEINKTEEEKEKED